MLNRFLRRAFPVLAAGALAWLYLHSSGPVGAPVSAPAAAVPQSSEAGHDAVRNAFEARARDVLLEASGRVERNLADDRDGSAHQRFIIWTDSGISLLIAHNIDLAPRLDGLSPGDTVLARGEYVWNDKGGVLHWTHHDPAGRHPGGYILWKGRRYE